MNTVKCFDFDDWCVLRDIETDEELYSGHGGYDLTRTLLDMLEIEQIGLEVDENGDTEKAINKYLKKGIYAEKPKKLIDQTGKKCVKCKKGKYKETKITDDWDGVLHCDKCGIEIYRYKKAGK